MKRPDIASGLVLVGLGIFVTQQSTKLSYRDEFGPGPGLLPFWLGLLVIALAALLVISNLTLPSSKGREKDQEAVPLPLGEGGPKGRVRVAGLYPRVALAWVGRVAMVAVLDALGFILSFGLLTFFLVYAVERRSLVNAVIVTIAMTLSFLLLFRVIIPLPLPASPWGF